MPSASIRKFLPFFHLSLSLSLKHTHTLSLSLTHTLAHTLSQSFSHSLSPDFLQNEVKIVTLNLMTSSFLLLCRDLKFYQILGDPSFERNVSWQTHQFLYDQYFRFNTKLLDQLKCYIPPIFFLSAQTPIKFFNGRLGSRYSEKVWK